MAAQLFRLTFQYHLKFIYRYVLFFSLWAAGISLLNVVSNRRYEQVTLLDAIMFPLGGYDSGNISLLQFFIALFPYVLLSAIVELYITKMMGSHAMASIIRIHSKTLYYCAHFVSLLVMMILFFAVYDFILLLVSNLWFQGTVIGAAEPFLHSLRLYSFPVIVFHIWGVQVIGSVTVALIQLGVAQWTKKATAGFVCVVCIYLLNLFLPDLRIGIGQHIVVMKTNVLSPDSLLMPLSLFYTLNVATLLIFIYVNVTRSSAVMFEIR